MESASLRSDFVQRIARLPRPMRASEALQPLFEAVSNSIHSTQDKFGEKVQDLGRIVVTIEITRKKDSVTATIEDNGAGLDEKNWTAFLTTDTDNKIDIGGKGVGRLLWLDCFEKIYVRSDYLNGSGLMRRRFEFALSDNNQIKDLQNIPAEGATNSGFLVNLIGLRPKYEDKFPGRGSYIFQHFMSHFLPTFIGKRCPKIAVIIGDERKEYPEAINEVIRRRSNELTIDTNDFGELKLTMMECEKIASSDLKGSNFVHFIAHDRTVHSHSIDGWLGLKTFGPENDSVFHAILTGPFLDKSVNQERTKFTFEEAVFERVVREVCAQFFHAFLTEPLALLDTEQVAVIESITDTYPSVAFGDVKELQEKVPPGELKADAVYGHLARERFRRDERQAQKIRSVLTRLKSDDIKEDIFLETIKETSKAIEETEQRSLADYVVRRRVVLDFMELLLEKVNDRGGEGDFQREDVLHSFICPLRASTIAPGSARTIQPAASHDLWIVDERLTFAQYFSSDVDFKVLADSADAGRPDLLIFDYVHGLRQSEHDSRVLLIEFKKPMRTAYSADEQPQFQVERYIQRLKSGDLKDVRGRPIQLNENTVFYCYIVADIVGKLADWTYTWRKTADGRGRIYRPEGGFLGSIELIGWDDLLKDARARNQAFFDKLGLSGKSLFSAE